MASYKPEDYELTNTLWFTTRNNEEQYNTNYVSLQSRDPPNALSFDDVRSLSTGPFNPLGPWAPLGNDFSISTSATVIEVNNPNSSITKTYRKGSFLISVPNGEISAEGYTYVDPVNEASQTITLNVSSGNGIFEDAKIMYITVDNDGSIFGQKYGNRVEIFKLKPKQTEETPPDFSGIFKREICLYGYLSKDTKIPIDQPLKFDQTVEVKQVGNFIEIKPLTYPPGFPERPDLPGVLEATYDENLKFSGWKVITVNTNNNNAIFSITPTKIENNVVIEFKEINYQAGFQEDNIEQSPLVGYSINKRVHL
jgi:hypothetical protein